MFGPPGIAYVYLVYGMYDCLNVVTEPAGRPAAVLIRAVEPLSGIDAMRGGRRGILRRRKNIAVGEASSAAVRDRVARIPAHRLASGPGLVAAAFGIDRSWTGTDLCDAGSPLRLERGPADKVPPEDIVATPRIGVGYAGPEWAARPWRFAIAGHRSVSVPRAAR